MKREKIHWMLAGAGIATICGGIFLTKLWFILLCFLAGLFLGRKKWKERVKYRYFKRQKAEFQAFLEEFSTRLEAGNNIRQSFQLANEHLNRLFFTDSDEMDFARSLNRMIENEKSGVSLRLGMRQLSDEMQEPLIQSFFHSLLVGSRQGANLGELSKTYLRILVEEEDLRKDRAAKLDASRREQALLFFMPILMLLLMNLTGLISDEYFLMDYIVRFICGFLFFIAWKWSRKILENSGLMDKKADE